MTWPRRVALTLLLAGTAVMLLACGSVRDAAVRNRAEKDLAQIAQYYDDYTLSESAPPKSADELIRYFGKQREQPTQGLVNGRCVIVWGVRMESNSGKKEIMGYDVETPEKGGYVLYVDKTVDRLSASEFAAAKKASPKK